MNSIIFPAKVSEASENPQKPGITVSDSSPIRSSVIVLIIQLIMLLLVTDVIYAFINYIFLRVHFLNLDLPFNLDHYVIGILLVIHILKTLLQIYLLIQVVHQWIGKTYYIVNEHLVEREGLLTITEKSYDLKNIRTVAVHQSALGKVFHYGDVIVETSASGGYMERFIMSGITNPNKYEQLLMHSVK